MFDLMLFIYVKTVFHYRNSKFSLRIFAVVFVGISAWMFSMNVFVEISNVLTEDQKGS